MRPFATMRTKPVVTASAAWMSKLTSTQIISILSGIESVLHGAAVVDIDMGLAHVPSKHRIARPLNPICCAQKEPQCFLDY